MLSVKDEAVSLPLQAPEGNAIFRTWGSSMPSLLAPGGIMPLCGSVPLIQWERMVVTTMTLLTIYSLYLCNLGEGKVCRCFHPCGEAMNAGVFVFVLNPVYNLVTFQLLFRPIWLIKDLALWFGAVAVQFGLCSVVNVCPIGTKIPNSFGLQVAVEWISPVLCCQSEYNEMTRALWIFIASLVDRRFC